MESNNKPLAEERKKLGNEEHKKGNYQAAIKYFNEAIELNPSEPTYYSNAAFSNI
jgi:tetratricopeptide (TPR) repeat protein